jgi:hypothetical protein
MQVAGFKKPKCYEYLNGYPRFVESSGPDVMQHFIKTYRTSKDFFKTSTPTLQYSSEDGVLLSVGCYRRMAIIEKDRDCLILRRNG